MMRSVKRALRLRGARQSSAGGMFCFALLTAALLLVSGLKAGSIFDDDFVPPKAAAPAAAPANSTTPAPPARPNSSVPVQPDAPDKKPITSTQPAVSDPASTASARRAIPAPAEQARSRKLFKEIYAKELADKSAAARRALATKLLEQASTIGDAPTDEFVLLVGAAQAGKEASDLAISCRAADALANAYDIDGLRFKDELALKMSLRGDSASAAGDNCRAGLKLVDECVAAADYTGASHLLQKLRAADPDAVLSEEIQRRSKEIDTIRIAADRVAPFMHKLKTAPDDPAANLAVGEYLCFDKDDWKGGLPFLAKASEPRISAAVALELGDTTDPQKQVELADAWWASSEKEGAAAQIAIRKRAIHWYQAALEGGSISGLKKVMIEKRVAAAGPSAGNPAGNPSKSAGVLAHATILKADYGDGKRTTSLTKVLQDALDADPFTPIGAGDSWGGDPAPGAGKTLVLSYRIGTAIVNARVKQDEIYLVPPIPREGVAIKGASTTFKIVAARYGAEKNWVDTTEAVRAEIADPSKPFKVRNLLGGPDLLFGKVKSMAVWFEFRGRLYALVAADNVSMTLVPK